MIAKVLVGLCLALVAAILAAKLAFVEVTRSATASGFQPWAQHSMKFVSWNGEKWTAWIRDGRFELSPRDTSDHSRHSNTSLAFVDWTGEPWQAKVEGKDFVVARRGDWHGPTEHVNAIRYRDWRGDNELRTVAQLT